MTISAALLSILIVSFWPAMFSADAVILLDGGGSITGLIDLAQMSDLVPPGAFGGQGSKENGNTYAEILKSRSLLTHILEQSDSLTGTRYFDRFAPRRGSESRRWEIAIIKLRRGITSRFDSKPSLFQVTVKDRDPRVAANLANLLISELQRFNNETRQTRARDGLKFVQGRLEEAKAALSEAEQKLAGFSARNARIGNAPELLLQQKRLERDVRINEETYALLARQLEIARIQEKKETPVFSLVDTAVPPTREQRFSPALAALLAGLVAAMCVIAVQIGNTTLKLDINNKAQ